MIGKFTEWLLENTDLLNEAQAIFANAHKAPRVTLDSLNNLNKIIGAFQEIPVDVYKNIIKYIYNRFEDIQPISSIGIPDTNRKGILGRKAPIIFYITTKNELNSSARLSMCKQLNSFSSPIKLENNYYLWSCDPNNHDYKKYNIIDSTDENGEGLTRFEQDEDKGTPSNSRFYLGIYEKRSNNVLALVQTIVYKIEVDKTNSYNNKNGKKIISSGIHDATQLLRDVFGDVDEGIIKANKVNNFIINLTDVIENYYNNKIISEFEKEFWQKIFNVKIKGIEISTNTLYGKETINGEPLLQYMAKTNYGIIASEILIPFYLVQGVKIINGINLIDVITEGSKSPVVNVSWPLRANEKYIDYSISTLETKDGKKYNISAKAGEKSHKPPLITLLKDVNINDYNLSKYKQKDIKIVEGLINIVNKFANLPNYPRAKITWFLGDYIKNKTKNIKTLSNLYDYLNSTDFDCSKNDKKHLETLGKNLNKMFGLNSIIEESKNGMYNTPYARCFPYSLTSYFEKQLNDFLNNNVEIRKIIEDIRFSDPVHNYAQVKLLPNTSKGFTISVLPPSTKQHDSKGNWYAGVGGSNGSTNKAITDNDLNNSKMIKLVCLVSKIKQFTFCNFDKCT
jgi:hypothetical protein